MRIESVPKELLRSTVEAAYRVGHGVHTAPTASGNRWRVWCDCGWGAATTDGRPTVTRATHPEAVRTMWHHLERAVAAWKEEARRNGVSVTGRVGAGL